MKNTVTIKMLSTVWLICVLPFFTGQSLGGDMWTPIFKEHLDGARAGDADAQYQVASMYLKGQGTKADREQAIHWLQEAVAQQHDGAKSRLRRIRANEEKFEQLNKQAKAGDTGAEYDLAQAYLNGTGTIPDEAKAIQWLLKAHEKGYSKATVRLGIVYFKSGTSDADYQRAFAYLTKVGDKNMLAQYYLGEMYAEGKGVKQDFHLAKIWYQRAGESGFNRAYGNVVNMEEEIQMEKRGLAKKSTEEASRVAEQAIVEQAAAVVPVRVAQADVQPLEQTKSTVKEPAKKPVAAKSAVIVPVEKRSTPTETVLASHWLRDTEPMDYLPSIHTRCEREDGRIICLSDNLQRADRDKTIRYRVKSIITVQDNRFDIVYRNLVLGVTEDADLESEDGPLGYDGEREKGYAVKTGWSSAHSVNCKLSSNTTLECVKNNSHSFTSRAVKNNS